MGFDSIIKSPKHPQSVTGFAIAIYAVNGNITNMNMVANHADARLIEPVSNAMPVVNSTTESAIDAVRVISLGISTPHTLRYSSILYINPHGSIALAHPDIMNVAPVNIRQIHIAVFVNADIVSGCLSALIAQFDDAEYGIIGHVHVIRIDTL